MSFFKTLNEAIASLQPGDRIFAFEPSVSSDYREFVIGPLFDLIVLFELKKWQRCHEVILQDEFMNLFFDLEISTKECKTHAEFQENIDFLLKQIPSSKYTVFDSSRDDKWSVHVIYNDSKLIKMNLAELKHYMNQLTPPPLNIWDKGVYARNHTLRMPYCTSFRAAPHILHPIGGPHHYDREWYFVPVVKLKLQAVLSALPPTKKTNNIN
jgi:hypothetical protein